MDTLSSRRGSSKPAVLLLGLAMAMQTGATAHADPQLPNIPAVSLNITDYGAVGDSATDNGPFIQSAINAAAATGGGTVVVAAVGVLTNYLSGPIAMSNNVCLEIDAGTKLQMLPMSSWANPSVNFINGSKLHDVAINGSGIIDGQGTNWWSPLAPTRPTLINFSGCTNVLIQNVTLQNPPTFHVVIKGGNVNVTIQGMTINSPFDSHNTDGIDIGSTNAVIRNCTINDGDDNIAFGSGSTGVTISNCAFGVGHGLSIGSSTSGGINNVLVDNCTWSGTEYGIHIKSARTTGGLVQNLTYRDLTMTNVNFVVAIYTYYDQIGSPSHVINETPFGASTNGVVVTNNIPSFSNITISNVTASTVGGIGNIAGIIWGLPEVLVSNVVMSHVNFTDATNTFCVYNAHGIQFIDCNLATPANTNTLTLYNADVTITNTDPNPNVVTLGGLAIAPTNNTLALFNGQTIITDTNELGAGPIILGGGSLTINQSPVTFSNNITAASASAFTLAGGANLYTGTLGGPLALNQPTGTLLLYGRAAFPAGGGPSTVANLTVGDCGHSIAGSILVSGGTLYVTNGVQSGVLDVRDGTVTLSNGLLQTDMLMMSNACGSVSLFGGTLASQSGAFSNGQAFAVGSGATFNLLGGVEAFGNQLVVSNNGTVSGCGTITGNVVINTGGSVQATCGSSLNFTGTVTNNATIVAANGTTINFFGPVVNNGTINGHNGILHFFSTFQGNAVLNDTAEIWTSSSGGKWEAAVNWSLGTAPGGTLSVFIANANTKTVTIDATTAVSAPSSLLITNLTVSGPGSATNTLNLSGATLHVVQQAVITNGGNMIISNATLKTDLVGISTVVNGQMSLLSGASVIATNGEVIIGFHGIGSVTLNSNSTALSLEPEIGALGGVGTLTLNGGTFQTVESGVDAGFDVAGAIGSTGTVWITGGTMIATNSSSTVGFGKGSLILSNGAVRLLTLNVGRVQGPGVVSMMNGTFDVSAFLNVGVQGGTGDVFVSGGQLTVTNQSAGTVIGTILLGSSAGVGRLTISNGTVLAHDLNIGSNQTAYGELNVVGGTFTLVSSNSAAISMGASAGAQGAMTVAGGNVIATNAPTVLGTFGEGDLIVSNGTMTTAQTSIGTGSSSQGSLTLKASAQMRVLGNFSVASGLGATGTVNIIGGQLTVTNGTFGIGNDGSSSNGLGMANVTVSNGTLLASGILQGSSVGGFGRLTLAPGGLIQSSGTNPPCVVYDFTQVGGNLSWTNIGGAMYCGYTHPGAYVLSNGISSCQDVYVGYDNAGSMTIAGGSMSILSRLTIGQLGSPVSTGAVWITGGQLTMLNLPAIIGNSGVGQMTISNGTVTATGMVLGNGSNPGVLTVAGGTTTIFSNLTIGNCGASLVGSATMSGGLLYVTNATHTAVLDVRDGTFAMNGGFLQVDKLIVTNSCGHFLHGGGTLLYNQLVVDPNMDNDGDGIPNGYELAHGLDPLNPTDANADNDGDGFSNLQEYLAGTDPNNAGSTPFHAASITQQGNDMLITWMTLGGTTNQVQSTSGSVNGAYATNGFTNLGGQMFIVGSGVVATNYTDTNGATNKPSRYYRVRLVP